MSKIIEAADLPEGDKVYLKKDILGWRVVEPWKNPETNKINWFNLLTGGKKNLALLLFLLFLSGLSYVGVNELISNYKKIAEQPCDYCLSCHEQTSKIISGLNARDNRITIPNSSLFQGSEING